MHNEPVKPVSPEKQQRGPRPPLRLVPGTNYRTVDLTHRRFGRLVVVGFAGLRWGKERRHATFRCRCDCGHHVVVRHDNLKNSNTTSCGCARRRGKPVALDVSKIDWSLGAATLGAAMTIEPRDGMWAVVNDAGVAVATFATNCEAWRFFDQNTDEGRDDTDRANRIHEAFSTR
jgi:hypothetical protein